MFDLRLIGDKDAQRTFRGLARELQVKVLRKSSRASAKRLQTEVLLNVSGRIVNERTGNLANAIEAENPRVIKSGEHVSVVGVRLPPRSAIGVTSPTGYYPAILEYGYSTAKRRMAAKAIYRRAVDDHADREFRLIARDLRTGVDKIAAQHANRGARRR